MPWLTIAAIAAPVIGGMISGNASENAADTQANAANRASDLTQQRYNQTRSDLMPWQQSGNVALSQLNNLLGLGNPGMAMPTREQFTHSVAPTASGGSGWQNLIQQIVAQRTGQQAGNTQQFDQAGFDAAMRQYTASQGQAHTQAGYGSLLRPFSLADFQQSPSYQFNLAEGQKAIDRGAAARGKYYAPATLEDLSKFSQGLASNEFNDAYAHYNQDQGNVFNRLFGMSSAGQSAANQTGALSAVATDNQGKLITGAGNAQAAGQVGSANAIGAGLEGAYNNYLLGNLLRNQQQPLYNDRNAP